MTEEQCHLQVTNLFVFTMCVIGGEINRWLLQHYNFVLGGNVLIVVFSLVPLCPLWRSFQTVWINLLKQQLHPFAPYCYFISSSLCKWLNIFSAPNFLPYPFFFPRFVDPSSSFPFLLPLLNRSFLSPLEPIEPVALESDWLFWNTWICHTGDICWPNGCKYIRNCQHGSEDIDIDIFIIFMDVWWKTLLRVGGEWCQCLSHFHSIIV